MLNLKHDVALKGETLRKQAGFTLIELLIVIAIIAILAAIAIPQFMKYKQGAYLDSVRSDVKNAVTAMEAYQATNGVYPTGVYDTDRQALDRLMQMEPILLAMQVVYLTFQPAILLQLLLLILAQMAIKWKATVQILKLMILVGRIKKFLTIPAQVNTQASNRFDLKALILGGEAFAFASFFVFLV